MEYRVGTEDLKSTLELWDQLLPGRSKVRLVACGGTALTLLGYKESTKDVDFLVPETEEYERLTGFLSKAGYRLQTQYGWKRDSEAILFDLYPGKKVYVTELLESPLEKKGSKVWKAWAKIEARILNPVDLIISKMFRGSEVDMQDSLLLMAREKINVGKLELRYRETARYDVSEKKVLKNLEFLLTRWKERKS